MAPLVRKNVLDLETLIFREEKVSFGDLFETVFSSAVGNTRDILKYHLCVFFFQETREFCLKHFSILELSARGTDNFHSPSRNPERQTHTLRKNGHPTLLNVPLEGCRLIRLGR